MVPTWRMNTWVRKITTNGNYIFKIAGTHRKNCSRMAGVKHELLAQGLLAATVAWGRQFFRWYLMGVTILQVVSHGGDDSSGGILWG